MVSQLIISPSSQTNAHYFTKLLQSLSLSFTHPDVLFLDNEKLGVEQSKQIREFLSIKPYSAKGRVVFILHADNLSLDAQNALLKTLEEPPLYATIVLAVENEQRLLPTIHSRCQMIYLDENENGDRQTTKSINKESNDQIEKLIKANLSERFQYIEKVDDKESLFQSLFAYYHERLKKDPDVVQTVKTLLEVEKWHKANGNIRAILEYIMLRMEN